MSQTLQPAGSVQLAARPERARAKEIKCVVWDLDETLWYGVLLEQSEVVLREGVREVIETLDARGILQSVASRNDHRHAEHHPKRHFLQARGEHDPVRQR